METRIDSLAEKLESLEKNVKLFRDEFSFKMKLVEQLLSTRNEELAVQSNCLQKEATLYKFLLTSWTDNTLEVQSKSAQRPNHQGHERGCDQGHCLSESAPPLSEAPTVPEPENPSSQSHLAVTLPVNGTITVENITSDTVDENEIHSHHHHFPHCDPSHGHGHGHGLGHGHGIGHGHGHSHGYNFGHGHSLGHGHDLGHSLGLGHGHIEIISVSEIRGQDNSTSPQNGELGEIVLNFHEPPENAHVTVESRKLHGFDPEEIETHGVEVNSNLNESLPSTSDRENENENSSSSITQVKMEEKFDMEQVEVEIIPNDELFSTVTVSDGPGTATASGFGYNCRICGSSQPTSDDLRSHMVRIHGGGGFICHYCGKNFAQLNSLNNHKRVHLEKKSLLCSICTNMEEFISLEILVEHMKTQHGIEKQVCEICEKEFAGPTYLKRHMCIFHNNEELEGSAKRNKQCSLCPKSYQTRADLLVHIRSHTGEKPYSCHGCQKHFADTRNLKRHQERFPDCKIAHISFGGCHRNHIHPPECRFKSTK